MKVELEARYYAVNVGVVRDRLQRLSEQKSGKGEGFRIFQRDPRRLLRRITWDIDPSIGKFFRVREVPRHTEFTLKCVKDASSIDGTYEHTVSIQGKKLDAMAPLFRALGLGRGSYQENERETWCCVRTVDGMRSADADCSAITIDYWPGLKPIVEIEVLRGSADMIDMLEVELKLPKRFLGDIPDIYAQEYNMTREEFNKIERLTKLDFPEIPFK